MSDEIAQQLKEGSSAKDAIEQVRTKRPSFIETSEQVTVIEQYERHRKNQASKPAHLTNENAARFQNQSVVDRYLLRLPYPAETFDILLGLIGFYRALYCVVSFAQQLVAGGHASYRCGRLRSGRTIVGRAVER